jgi:hypothetical protein
MSVNTGLLLFRGSDAHERTPVLLLQETLSQSESNQRGLTLTAPPLFRVAGAKSSGKRRRARSGNHSSSEARSGAEAHSAARKHFISCFFAAVLAAFDVDGHWF